MPAPDWTQKMLCIIVPNRRTVSPEFFSWVRTRRLLFFHTCPVHSPSLCEQGKLLFSTFLTRNEGTTDETRKRLGCYQHEQFNLSREYSVFDSSQSIINNRKLKLRRRRESQISNSLTRQNNNFARASHFFVHFFAFNCTTTRENAYCSFMFCEGRKQAMTKFILFMNLDMVDRNSAPEDFACIWQSKRVGMITIETEKMWIPFTMLRFCGRQPSWYLF